MINIVETFGTLEFKICDLYYREKKTLQDIAKAVKKRITYINAVVKECKKQYDEVKLDGNAMQILPVNETVPDSKKITEDVEEQMEILVFRTMPEQVLGMNAQIMEEEMALNLIMEDARQFAMQDSLDLQRLKNGEIQVNTEEDLRNFKEMQKIKKGEVERISKKISIFSAGSRARGGIFRKRKEVFQVASEMIGVSVKQQAKPKVKNTFIVGVDATGGKNLKSMKTVVES